MSYRATPPALRRLAKHVVKEQFGPIILAVADLLISRYPSRTTLKNLNQHCPPHDAVAVRQARPGARAR